MNKSLSTLGLSLVLALGSAAAHAANYYVSDCQAGAVAGCIAGSDSNAGTSEAAPWKTTAKVLSRFSSLAAGDSILFARGGVWTNAAMWGLRNLNSSIANPIVFDNYQPSWYSGTKLPLLTDMQPGITIFAFTGNPIVANEGYVVRNLEVRGSRAHFDTSGFFINQGAGGLIIDNVTTRDLNIGFYCGDGSPNNTIRNSTITHSFFAGVFGGCVDWLVDNNIFDNNGYRPDPGFTEYYRNHAIYIGRAPETVSDVTIRRNTFTNSVKFAGVCQGVVIVGHGQMNNIVIEDNLIDESENVGPNKGGCWGIAFSPAWLGTAEKLENVIIRRNRVVNVGGIGIEIGGCNNCFVENNVIVKNDGLDAVGIGAPGMRVLAEDAPMGKLTIRNNSIYFGNNSTPWGSTGIQVSRGSNHVLVGNLINFAAPHTGNSCFNNDGTFPALPLSSFTAYDNNLCYRGDSGRYSQNYTDLVAAKAAGFDKHGLAVRPQTAKPVAGNKYSMALRPISPAIGAGHATHSAAKDIDKAKRGAESDIGAFEFPGDQAKPPSPPRSVSAALIPGTTNIKVTFLPPARDGRRAITGYTVTSNPAGGVDAQGRTKSLEHTISGLSSGTRYTFTVSARNSAGVGEKSAPSNGVSIP